MRVDLAEAHADDRPQADRGAGGEGAEPQVQRAEDEVAHDQDDQGADREEDPHPGQALDIRGDAIGGEGVEGG
jgi:hypothetical protein